MKHQGYMIVVTLLWKDLYIETFKLPTEQTTEHVLLAKLSL